MEKIAQKRLEICRANTCGLYDAKGESSICVKKGSGCCSGCGCNDLFKTHSLSSYCYLKDIGRTPLWKSEMSEVEEEMFRANTGLKNE